MISKHLQIQNDIIAFVQSVTKTMGPPSFSQTNSSDFT